MKLRTWFFTYVLIWLTAIACTVWLFTVPAEGGARSPRAHVTTIQNARGGNVGEWNARVVHSIAKGETVCLRGRIESAATLMLDLHRFGLLAIDPDAMLGFHAVGLRNGSGYHPIAGNEAAQVRTATDVFSLVYGAFPGLWEWYAAGPILDREMKHVPGSWFNAQGVPEC